MVSVIVLLICHPDMASLLLICFVIFEFEQPWETLLSGYSSSERNDLKKNLGLHSGIKQSVKYRTKIKTAGETELGIQLRDEVWEHDTVYHLLCTSWTYSV